MNCIDQSDLNPKKKISPQKPLVSEEIKKQSKFNIVCGTSTY